MIEITLMITHFFVKNELQNVWSEFILSMGLFALLIIGAIFNNKKNLILKINLGAIFLLVLAMIFVLPLNHDLLISDNLILKNYKWNFFTQYMKFFVLLFTAVCLFAGQHYYKIYKIKSYEYLILILLGTLGYLILISSTDFLTLYLALEIQSLASYTLSSFKKDSVYSVEAGLKYFVLGALASGLLLFGISFIYGFSGTIQFHELKLLLADSYSPNDLPLGKNISGIIIGLVFLFSGLLFKLGAAPFHMWLPDVYEGSPYIVSMYFASVSKIALISILIRLAYDVFGSLQEIWAPMIITSSILSMIVGSFTALQQRKIKRFLAFSSITHVGYILIGLVALSPQGLSGLIHYVVLYSINTILIWVIPLSLIKSNNDKKEYKLPQYLTDLALLGNEHKFLALSFSLALISFAGIPPLSGFFAKAFLWYGAIVNKLFFLLTVSIFISLIGSFYYFRIIKIIYYETPAYKNFYHKIEKNNALLIVILTIILALYCLFPDITLGILSKIANDF